MIAVVSIFAILHEVAFKQLGVALAARGTNRRHVGAHRPPAVGDEAARELELVLPRARGQVAQSCTLSCSRRRNWTSPQPKPSKTKVKEGKAMMFQDGN